ncbi:MAG: 50S ribosomal protein L9 [Bacteriovoracia bacterium]
MKVILRENIENLGKTGDIVKVSDGFARNFLLPRNLVEIADENNVKAMDHHKKVLSKKREKEVKSAGEIAKQLESFSCTIETKVGENDKLFGSITNSHIADSLKKAGFQIDRRAIQLPEPIRQAGVHTVAVKLHSDVSAKIKVWVVPEKT